LTGAKLPGFAILRVMVASDWREPGRRPEEAAIEERLEGARQDRFESLMDEHCGERARQSDPERDRQTSDLIFHGHSSQEEAIECRGATQNTA
jgi:hypothetical protein